MESMALTSILTTQQIDDMLQQLTERGYRISRPFEARSVYGDSTPPAKLLKAVVLDTETTGTNPDKDRIIELGMVFFEYCPESGQAYRVLHTYNELEDPGFPIPAESIKVHHITDDMVAGKRIDDAQVEALLADVSLVIAHNAKFDRDFAERRFPIFEKKPWACSVSQVPWNDEGMGSAKLEFLAYRCGFHYTGHRASNDCHALLEVLQQPLPESGDKALKRLLDNARMKEIKVWALGSPFDSKDALKERGYRWQPERKLWAKAVPLTSLDNEVAWLKAAVYGGRGFQLEQEWIDALNRFSIRRGPVEVVRYT